MKPRSQLYVMVAADISRAKQEDATSQESKGTMIESGMIKARPSEDNNVPSKGPKDYLYVRKYNNIAAFGCVPWQ
jgi:hypothetical protein